MEILKINNLKKSYIDSEGELTILNGITFEVSKGTMVAITGESGSGKSTLLHLLSLLDKADSGEILYNGKKITGSDKLISKFRNKSIGFIFQFHYLLEDFTAIENVAMPMFLATGNMKTSLLEAEKLLKRLDLINRKHHYPNQLSGGEQQRIAIARALINKPDIVFADEPTGNLDKKHSDEIFNLLRELNREIGQTFIIVTHDEEIASQLDIHYFLENGLLQLHSAE